MDELVLALAPVQSFRASPTRVYPPSMLASWAVDRWMSPKAEWA